MKPSLTSLYALRVKADKATAAVHVAGDRATEKQKATALRLQGEVTRLTAEVNAAHADRLPSVTLMHTPHASQILAGVAQSPRPYNRLTRLTADCGSILIMSEHDAYCAGHEFDLIASGGMTLADLREIHAYISANVVIPSRNA